MPRRKQEAPKRAAAYSPEDLKEDALEDEGAEEGEELADDDLGFEEDDRVELEEVVQATALPSERDYSELSGRDSESHVSDGASDRLSDFESPAAKPQPLPSVAAMEVGFGPDTLEQMKAIYSSFLTNSYWSPLNFNPVSAPPLAPPPVEKPARTSSTSSSSSCSSGSYDWHQSAVAKTLQQHQTLRQPAGGPEGASLFSTVQLHRQNPRLFGSIFTGASKFRCKGCSAAYDTLVELTVHMNDTGHYRDDNHKRAGAGAKRWSKPRKRSLMEMEGKEDAQKVLKCMYCGNSFESLQDLSVHMIKTKHYQKVPLKEPMAPLAAKTVSSSSSSSRKRAHVGLDLCASPRSREGTPKPKHPTTESSTEALHKGSTPYSSNHRYGHQNGASYAWQFESHKAQILKCMDCGSSHNTLQELRSHMMATGHFVRVSSSAAGKRGRNAPPDSASSLSPARVATPMEDRVQSVPLAPSTFSPPPAPPPTTSSPPSASSSSSPPLKDIKKEEEEEECSKEATGDDGELQAGGGGEGGEEEEKEEEEEKFDVSKYNYLTEEDLKESPRGGLDILKSLENTVASAINKAQSGNPSWGGYPSIHAAYQFPSSLKLPPDSMALDKTSSSSPLKFLFSGAGGGEGGGVGGGGGDVTLSASLPKSMQLVSPPLAQSSPRPHNNVQAMEDLVKKVTEKVERRVRQRSPKKEELRLSPCSSEGANSSISGGRGGERGADSPREWQAVTPTHNERASPAEPMPTRSTPLVKSPSSSSSSSLSGSGVIITGHPPAEQPFINPLSALQSVMNVHLGKAAKPALPSQDPLSLLSRLSQSMAERAAVAHTKKPPPAVDHGFSQPCDEQPMDLTKGKSERGAGCGSVGSAPLTPSSTSSSVSPSSLAAPAKLTVVSPYTSSSPPHENALSDISDMLRNLTQAHHHHVPKPASRSRLPDRGGHSLSSLHGSTNTPDEAEGSPGHNKRKGRQSNWNPQHLLLLQAQFSSSLRQTSEGRYVINDLSPQERMHVSRFTGLSMTTISHWLANVKYQLRRTGRTKFLKNLESGQPVFYCSDCASQVRTPAAYICHLEAHLGFRLRDLAKISPKQSSSSSGPRDAKQPLVEKLPLEAFLLASQPQDDGAGGPNYRCQLCVRKFASKHAVKLHLSKSHGKSPEDHLLYVLEKH